VRICEPTSRGWECRMRLRTEASQERGMVTASSIDISPDGTHLLTCSKGATAVSMWDLANGKLLARFAPETGERLVRHVLSPDGRFLVTATRGQREEVSLWDMATRMVQRRVALESEFVKDLAISPNGQLLACATNNGVLLLDTKELQQRLFIRGDHVFGVAFSPDSQYVAIPSNEFQLIRLWNVAANREVATLPFLGEPHSVAFTPDGNRLLAMTARSIRTWLLGGSGDKRVLAGHSHEVTRLAFSPEDKFLVSAGGQEVKFWDPATGKLLRTLSGFKGAVRSVALNPDATL